MTRFRSVAPLFQVADVGATMGWYRDVLGFTPHPFPAKPPFVFGILEKDGVEVMLQRVEGQEPLDVYRKRPAGVWHAYLRMEGVGALYDQLRGREDVVILEPLKRQPYGDTEFVVKDPNGYVLVFSELVD